MPTETIEAIAWALEQTYIDEFGVEREIKKEDRTLLVDHVRKYFNENNIEYGMYSYEDLVPLLK